MAFLGGPIDTNTLYNDSPSSKQVTHRKVKTLYRPCEITCQKLGEKAHHPMGKRETEKVHSAPHQDMALGWRQCSRGLSGQP